MEVLALRTALQSLLTSALGTYTLGNGTTTAAVHVRAVGEARPSGVTVTGMELVIVRDPELDPIPQYKNPNAFRRWIVYLVDWGGSADLKAAAALVLNSYPSTTIETLSVPEAVGPRNQMRLEIQTT
jgi:hypothetical protein